MKKTGRVYPLICIIDGLHVGLIVPALLAVLFFDTFDLFKTNTPPEWIFGILLALPYCIKMLFLSVAKGIAHRVGVRATLIGTTAFFATGSFLTGLAFEVDSLALLVVSRIVLGFGMLTFPLMILTGSLGIFDPKMSMRIQGYGITLGPLVGSLSLFKTLEIALPFYLAAILCLFSLTLFLFTKIQETGKAKTFASKRFSPRFSELESEDVSMLLIALFFIHAAWTSYLYDAPLFAFKLYRFSIEHLVILFTIFCLGLQIGLGIFSRWASRFGHKGVVIGSYIIVGLIMLLETAPRTSYLLWILSAPAGIMAGIGYTHCMRIFQILSKNKQIGDAGLFASIVQSFAAFVGLIAVGFFSSIKPFLPLISSFILLCIGISFILLGRFKRLEKEEVF